MNHIELFAGCGGLNLGLGMANFELVFANELSPMAAETFAYNFFNEDLSKPSSLEEHNKHIFWLSSQFKDIKSRLRENPFQYPKYGEGYSDIPSDPAIIKGGLIVADIVQLNNFLLSNQSYLNAFKNNFNNEEIDLISGGPPCQSFSLAGLRKKDCEKNTLPWEFARFVEMIQPKFVLLENVTGILRAFKEDGITYHAWFEVAKVFADKGYIPLCLHVNAKLAGVPQNRPRFIMLGVRHDIYTQLKNTFNEAEINLFKVPFNFYTKISSSKSVELKDLKYFDASKESDYKLFKQSFLASLVQGDTVSCGQALGDLKLSKKEKKSNYVDQLNKFFSQLIPLSTKVTNHEPRNNSLRVQRRFRIYQIIRDLDLKTANAVRAILKGQEDHLDDEAWQKLSSKEFFSLLEHKKVVFKNKSQLIEYLKEHPTKKQTQKALRADAPAPATLSIPDDACHYDSEEIRTLTVREMARIQSFPDGFVFKSKITTGGNQRKFEVPQYTQVGNAVPPLLGFALGCALNNLEERLEN